MFTRWLFFILSILMVAMPVHAQEYEWKILFYDSIQINVLTAAGVVETIPVPRAAQGLQRFSGLNHMALSPDQRYLVFVSGEGGGDGVAPAASLQIADLVEQTCCETVPAPNNLQPDSITVGPFSPDGTQFVANFATVYTADDEPPVLVTIDLETLTIVHTLDLMDMFDNQGAFLHDWTEDGISLFPTCLACGGPIDGYFSRWQPATGAITSDAFYFNWLGDRLDTRGELLVPMRDESRPVSNDDGMIPPSNVIEYLSDGDPNSGVQVYFDPDMLNLPHPYWVQGGAAYLLHNWAQPTATLIQRDGTSQIVDLPAELHFVASTPDGWLMQRNEAELYQFQVSADAIVTYQEIQNISGPVVILTTPESADENLVPLQPIIG